MYCTMHNLALLLCFFCYQLQSDLCLCKRITFDPAKRLHIINVIRESERSSMVVGDFPGGAQTVGRQQVRLYAISDDSRRYVASAFASCFEADVLVKVPKLWWVQVRQQLHDDRDVFPAPEVDALEVRRRRFVRDFHQQFL